MSYLKYIFFLLLSFNCIAQGEISLFNSEGEAVAYIDTEDDDLTLYLWDGKPVAYLHVSSGEYHVYGFNGKHLGWYINGVIRNHDGDAVVANKAAVKLYNRRNYSNIKIRQYKYLNNIVE